MALYLEEYKKRFAGDVYFYGNASHALYDVLNWLQELRPKTNPNIVLPVFIPAKLYRLVLAAGYEPRFYDIPLNCGLDPGHIINQIDDQTQAVFCIHYFGIPSPVQEMRYVTRSNNIYLIEDCAHTINSRWMNKELGTIGDCALFSTRKMLQLPAGGFLAFNGRSRNFKPSYRKRVRSIYTVCKGVRSRLKTGYFHLTRGHDPFNLARIPQTGYINFSEKHQFNIKEISRANEFYSHSVDLDRIARIRRQNYEYVLNGIKGHPFVEPVGGLHDNPLFYKVSDRYRVENGFTPYSFPVLTPLGMRETYRKILCKAGIGCGAGWPETPFGHKNFEQTSELSRRLLELPIHQGMTRLQLERMIQCLRGHQWNSNGTSEIKTFLQRRKNSKLKTA